MVNLLIGHRGVGKTALLGRLANYYQTIGRPVIVCDLDEEIERRSGEAIASIFARAGEAEFRRWEHAVLGDLLKELAAETAEVYIAIGAGFSGDLPAGPGAQRRVIWVRRPTDDDGRIFLDRPRLDAGLSPLDEYRERARWRSAEYARLADEEVFLPEGLVDTNSWEPVWLGLSPAQVGGSVTLLPSHFQSPVSLRHWLTQAAQWNLDFLELRDDFLTINQVSEALDLYPAQGLLFSFRSSAATANYDSATAPLSRIKTWDWPAEWGVCPFGSPRILSLHTRDYEAPLQAVLVQLESAARSHPESHLKLAIPIANWEELRAGHRWWSEDPSGRSFLPRSLDGRWQWYRLLQKGKMKLNFWREGLGSSLDQPPLLDWLRAPFSPSSFAAVLGDPVHHSWTPIEQQAFFAERNMPILAVRVGEEELGEGALSTLTELGLQYAAVTSPLKNVVFNLCQRKTAIAQSLGAVNTLGRRNKEWWGTNTDVDGLRIHLSSQSAADVAVWGGGGTKAAIQAILPQAHTYSARRGTSDTAPVGFSPDVIVWAVGRSRRESTLEPPEGWRPTQIVDLNYTADSPGLAYALKVGAHYTSGALLFRAQAAAQRQFWEEARTGHGG